MNTSKSLCVIKKYPPLMIIRKKITELCPIWIRNYF